MPFESGIIKTDCKKLVAKSQLVVECNLTKAEGKINKLLLKKAMPKIVSYETLSEEVRFDMNVDFSAVFLDENDSIDSMNFTEMVSDNIKNEKINSLSKIMFDLQMVDIQVVSVSGNKIVLQSVIEISVFDISSKERKFVSGLVGVMSKNEEVENFAVTSFSTSRCNITSESELNDNIDKVLVAEGKGVITKVSSGLDCVVVQGKCFVTLTFCRFDDMTDVFTKNYEIEFQHEMENTGALVEHIAEADCYIDNLSATVNVDTERRSSVVKIDSDIVINAYTYKKETLSLPVDAFSVTNELEITKNSLETSFLVDSFISNEKIDSTSFITENMPKVDKILSSFCSNLNITNVKTSEQMVEIEGIATVGVLYYSDDKICSVETETPFVVNLKNPNILATSFLNVTGAIMEAVAKHKKTDSIDIYIEVVFKVDIFENKSCDFIEEIVEGEEKKQTKSAITVYIARENEELWDICKMLGSDEETIIRQNAELNFPLTQGDRVVLYRQKNTNIN